MLFRLFSFSTKTNIHCPAHPNYHFLSLYVGSNLSELQEDDNPIKDVGLRGEVITGESSDAENDLIRYSNYISGAGSTFGGFMSGFPGDAQSLVTGNFCNNMGLCKRKDLIFIWSLIN